MWKHEICIPSAALRADHLAVLWFVAEAEGVAVQLVRVYVSEEKLMESELYKSIFAKGEARGEARGRAEAHASALVRFLMHRLGAVDPELRRRIRACTDADALETWADEVFLAADEAAVRHVLDRIAKTLPA